MDAENSTTTKPKRVVGRPWPKGVSGNPGGLRKDIPALVREARRLALSFAPKAVGTLAELLDNPDPRVRVSAAEGLLDRAGLRPYSLEPERVEIAATVDLDALRATLTARVGALVQAREAVVELGVLTPESNPDPALPPPGRGQVPESAQ